MLTTQIWDVCSDQEAVDYIRNVNDPVSASKMLVDHALSRFSTDNLSCMVVRFEKDATIQSQNNKDVGVESENGTNKISEVDKLVGETKQKIADGSNPAVGVSASNSGRGHDPVLPEESDGFVPTSLDGAVLEEEPSSISDDGDSPEVTPVTEKAPIELGSKEVPKATSDSTEKTS